MSETTPTILPCPSESEINAALDAYNVASCDALDADDGPCDDDEAHRAGVVAVLRLRTPSPSPSRPANVRVELRDIWWYAHALDQSGVVYEMAYGYETKDTALTSLRDHALASAVESRNEYSRAANWLRDVLHHGVRVEEGK